MGLLRAAEAAAQGILADQWLEYFYCESLPATTLASKGLKRINDRGQNVAGSDNVISHGSRIAVADGQCMLVVNQGRVLDVCAEPGEYRLDLGGEPSMFAGAAFVGNAFKTLTSTWDRMKFGGQPGRDTRVYYFNTKELTGNKYGTPGAIPFRVVDKNIGLDIDIAIRFYGEYAYRVANPVLFYSNVTGNFSDTYTRDVLESQLKSELLGALQPAVAAISAMGIRYSALPGHTSEFTDALNAVLSAKWQELRGLEVASVGVSAVNASAEDAEMIKGLQRTAVFRDPTMAAAHMVDAQAAAMQAAAANESGAMLGFAGLGMAHGNAARTDASHLYSMGQTSGEGANGAAASDTALWTCKCGAQSSGRFCHDCGTQRVLADGWTCECGTVNKGRFCGECGKEKPVGAPRYKCDKCGYEPPDPTTAPRFCPDCGDPFDDNDLI